MARHSNDIKAPDGFLLGGLRRVRGDRTVLFQRGYYGPCPEEWVGQSVWVHDNSDNSVNRGDISAAPPGEHIHTARCDGTAVPLYRTERKDAKPGYRNPHHVAWAKRNTS